MPSARDGITWWTDPLLPPGVIVGFSERGGGASVSPYATLNLAGHVGDDPAAVDENRRRLLEAVGLTGLSEQLVTAEQVHGDTVAVVTPDDAGRGAHAGSGLGPIAASDALVTRHLGIPLMLFFADCVPVILVAPGPGVALAHAGWRGALASIPGKTACELAKQAGCRVADVRAYVGPHIGPCHYEVGDDVMSQFCNAFGTVARAESGGLNLDAAVTASLVDAGVASCNIARLGTCTAETTDRFFSHRAEHGRTGRHSAFACIV